MPPLLRALKEGWERMRDHPQLWLTVLVALAIVASFSYVSLNFLNIAKSAQDELVRVRIGSLQDAFAPLAADLWQEPDRLRNTMRELRTINPTIQDFDIATQEGTDWVVVRSADESREGSKIFRQDLLFTLAASDPSQSYTAEESENGIRYFYTTRAIRTASSTILGIIVTRQTLSAADEAISGSLQQATIILVVVILFLLLLFFRHARIIDYTVLYRKLREVDQLKDEFIAMASHELRAPLTAIRGYAEMLKEGKLADAERTQALQRIDTSAQQLDSLIADMLDVSRIEQGRMKIEAKPLDPKPALVELADIWKSRATEKGLSLAADIADGLTINVDPDRFRQVTINFLSNAVKYTKQGKVEVHGYEDRKHFVLDVSDTGIGMTEEEIGKLFAKFYRAPGEDVRAQSGTGLGLWITKQLIEQMGGSVSVESIKGVGSHFIVRFPLAGKA